MLFFLNRYSRLIFTFIISCCFFSDVYANVNFSSHNFLEANSESEYILLETDDIENKELGVLNKQPLKISSQKQLQLFKIISAIILLAFITVLIVFQNKLKRRQKVVISQLELQLIKGKEVNYIRSQQLVLLKIFHKSFENNLKVILNTIKSLHKELHSDQEELKKEITNISDFAETTVISFNKTMKLINNM